MSSPAKSAFIGALSFEPRASYAFERLAPEAGYSRAVFLDYGSTATPGDAATSRREEAWSRVSAIGRGLGVPVERRRVHAYAMGDAQRELAHQSAAHEVVTVDVSCMTRPHVLGAASTCAKAPSGASWELTYSRPWSYGELDKPSASLGWRDSLLLSLAEDPSFSNEGVAVGIFLPGNESDRATVAFDTIEPASGVIVGVRQATRPDIYRLTAARNEVQTRHLRNLRVPGPLGREMVEHYPYGGWVSEDVDAQDLIAGLASITRQVVVTAKRFEAPVILFPFGPKVAVFVTAYALAATYPEGSWAVYPVPHTHPLDYSEGARSLTSAAGTQIAELVGDR